MARLTVELEDVPKRFDEILGELGRGTEVIVHRNGQVQQDYRMTLVCIPPKPERGKRVAGALKGKIWMAPDFDAPMTDDFWLGES